MLWQMKGVIAPRVKDWILCGLSAVLLILSFPNFNLWIFAWVGFVPLFFAIKNKSKWRAFWFFYLSGVIFWFGIIYWLVHVTLAGTIILVLYLALYFGFFGLVFSAYSLKLTAYSWFFVPSAWVFLEYLRSHFFSGFPWALLGYSQYLNLPMIQIADITGVWGVSFLVMMVNAVVYTLIFNRLSLIDKLKRFSLIISCLIIVLIYGAHKIGQTPNTKHQTPLKISVIQGNIPQELKWDTRARGSIIERYFNLTVLVIKDKPSLIIWPEAALPAVLEEEPAYFDKAVNFTKGINIPVLLGAVTYRDDIYYNSAILISQKGKESKRYDKIHLVPFGEYIPFRRTFRFLETIAPIGDIAAGKEYAVFKISGSTGESIGSFSVLICFEDLFPELSRSFVNNGANFLVNITNDAWFGDTSSPYQHLSASVFRAVENRVFLVRSANTGVSGFISPEGRIVSLIKDERGRNTFIPGYATQNIAGHNRSFSFYTRHGDLFIVACLLFILGTTVFILKRRK